MSDIAIRVEALGKQYQIGQREPYGALRDVLMQAVRGKRRPEPEMIWALKDVSFEIKQGEVIGLIGRNGAGKSTLLKILSRVTKPTEGMADVWGRVGSLLEVGTGFHPELTGRENIYLNGAILGMRRVEMDRKFDEIVAFAETEQFLDTPVKHYSSGMRVRLAFAVAAHLQPEILLVDEVLAVGDAAFQKKCLGKMNDVAKSGRTILFVSHNMAAMMELCESALWLDRGRLAQQGTAREIVQAYLQSVKASETVALNERMDRAGDGSARMISVAIASLDSDGVIRSRSRLQVTIRYRSAQPLRHASFLAGVYDLTNTGIYLLNSDASRGLPEILPAAGCVRCITEAISLTPGRCFVNLALKRGGAMTDYVQYAAYFDVEPDDVEPSGKVPPREWVLCVLRHDWSLEEAS